MLLLIEKVMVGGQGMRTLKPKPSCCLSACLSPLSPRRQGSAFGPHTEQPRSRSLAWRTEK